MGHVSQVNLDHVEAHIRGAIAQNVMVFLMLWDLVIGTDSMS